MVDSPWSWRIFCKGSVVALFSPVLVAIGRTRARDSAFTVKVCSPPLILSAPLFRFDARTLLDFLPEESRISMPADVESRELNEINFQRYRDLVRAKSLGSMSILCPLLCSTRESEGLRFRMLTTPLSRI